MRIYFLNRSKSSSPEFLWLSISCISDFYGDDKLVSSYFSFYKLYEIEGEVASTSP